MTADATRAVLLARAGEARTRLQAALRDAGAEVVLAADPAETSPEAVGACSPQAVLVALEPAVEDSLDAFGAFLADPSLIVVYDEAELAAQREGWDAARWVRHLAAKLRRSDGVLPPGGESDDDFHPSPGALPRREDPGPLALEVMAGEALGLADDVPRGEGPLGGARLDPSPDLSLDDLQLPDPEATDADADVAPASASRGEDGLVGAELAADAGDETEAGGADINLFANLSLVVDDAPVVDPGTPGAAAAAAASAGSARGAVVIEGGIGGPDAARTLLSALPVDLPRAVLVRLVLDGGRYDRLVTQMARASAMPVELAEPGGAMEAGKVYFLPPGLGLAGRGDGLVFAASDDPTASLHGALSAEDSAVILLSGSDPALVDVALARGAAGALVAAQPVADCYEATAATALVARGGESSDIEGLAARIAARWAH